MCLIQLICYIIKSETRKHLCPVRPKYKEVRLTSSVHPLVRPTKSGLLNILYGVLEISISLRQPVYFCKFTSGLKKMLEV